MELDGAVHFPSIPGEGPIDVLALMAGTLWIMYHDVETEMTVADGHGAVPPPGCVRDPEGGKPLHRTLATGQPLVVDEEIHLGRSPMMKLRFEDDSAADTVLPATCPTPNAARVCRHWTAEALDAGQRRCRQYQHGDGASANDDALHVERPC